MSTVADALGTRTTPYTFEGTTYTLSPADLGDYGAYELSLEEAGWSALKRARQFKWLQPFEYKEMVREFLALLMTHQHTFGTDDYIKSTQTLPGIQKMLELALAHNHPEFKRDPLGVMPGEKTLSRMAREDTAGVTQALMALDPPDSNDSA